MTAGAGFRPTHRTPPGGLDSWPRPDPTAAAGPHIDAGLDVQVLDRSGDWARVLFHNGWAAWVDARRLLAATTPQGAAAPTASSGPTSSTPFDRRRGGALAGAGMLAVSAFLPWLRGGGTSIDAFDLVAAVLFDHRTTATGGVKVGMLLLVVAAAGAAVVLLRPDRRAQIVAGLAGAAIPVLYLVQLQRSISDLGQGSVTDVAGLGIAVAAVGGAVLAATAPKGAGR